VTYDAKTRTLKFKIDEIKKMDVREHEYTIKVSDNHGATNKYILPVIIKNVTLSFWVPPPIEEEEPEPI
jgi:hypothetical protein